MFPSIAACDLVGLVGRSVTDNHPLLGKDRLRPHGVNSPPYVGRFVFGRSYQNVFHIFHSSPLMKDPMTDMGMFVSRGVPSWCGDGARPAIPCLRPDLRLRSQTTLRVS